MTAVKVSWSISCAVVIEVGVGTFGSVFCWKMKFRMILSRGRNKMLQDVLEDGRTECGLQKREMTCICIAIYQVRGLQSTSLQ